MKKILISLLLALMLLSCQLSEELSVSTDESEFSDELIAGTTKGLSNPGADVGDIWARLNSPTIKMNSAGRFMLYANTGSLKLGALGFRLRYNHNIIEPRVYTEPYPAMRINPAFSNPRPAIIVRINEDISEIRFSAYSVYGLPPGEQVELATFLFLPVAPGTANFELNIQTMVGFEKVGTYFPYENAQGIPFSFEVID